MYGPKGTCFLNCIPNDFFRKCDHSSFSSDVIRLRNARALAIVDFEVWRENCGWRYFIDIPLSTCDPTLPLPFQVYDLVEGREIFFSPCAFSASRVVCGKRGRIKEGVILVTGRVLTLSYCSFLRKKVYDLAEGEN